MAVRLPCLQLHCNVVFKYKILFLDFAQMFTFKLHLD